MRRVRKWTASERAAAAAEAASSSSPHAKPRARASLPAERRGCYVIPVTTIRTRCSHGSLFALRCGAARRTRHSIRACARRMQQPQHSPGERNVSVKGHVSSEGPAGSARPAAPARSGISPCASHSFVCCALRPLSCSPPGSAAGLAANSKDQRDEYCGARSFLIECQVCRVVRAHFCSTPHFGTHSLSAGRHVHSLRVYACFVVGLIEGSSRRRVLVAPTTGVRDGGRCAFLALLPRTLACICVA